MAALRTLDHEPQPVPARRKPAWMDGYEAFHEEWARERDLRHDEYEEHGTELVHVEAQPPTLFGTSDPAAVIVKATEAAKPLADVVRKQNLTTNIQGKEYCRVEAWTLLGSMLGVFPVCVWTRRMEDGWEARVEARTRDGAIVGAAEAECLRSENTWKSRDDYALRSMAQTRATSKALRQPLGFVMQLAGFEATPAEEMPREPDREPRRDDPQGRDESRADHVADSDHASVQVHFGSNTGKRLGDLSRRSREWYAGDGWAEKKAESGREVTDADRRLRRAARVLSGMRPEETTGPFGNESEIPF